MSFYRFTSTSGFLLQARNTYTYRLMQDGNANRPLQRVIRRDFQFKSEKVKNTYTNSFPNTATPRGNVRLRDDLPRYVLGARDLSIYAVRKYPPREGVVGESKHAFHA